MKKTYLVFLIIFLLLFAVMFIYFTPPQVGKIVEVSEIYSSNVDGVVEKIDNVKMSVELKSHAFSVLGGRERYIISNVRIESGGEISVIPEKMFKDILTTFTSWEGNEAQANFFHCVLYVWGNKMYFRLLESGNYLAVLFVNGKVTKSFVSELEKIKLPGGELSPDTEFKFAKKSF